MMQPYHVLINAQSGTASAVGREAIEAALSESQLKVESFEYLEAKNFLKRVSEISDFSDKPVLIGGGDGTISHAGNICFKNGKSFGILPFGTMNMMAKDLKIPSELSEMFRAYETSQTVSIDVGVVNGRAFLCCAALGVIPEASRFREATREMPEFISIPQLGAFVFQELDKTRSRKIYLTMDGKRKSIKTNALVISDNQYSLCDGFLDDNHFQRESLQEERLGIYTVSPPSLWAKIRLMARLQLGAWKNDPALKEYTAREAIIETGRKQELISIDGEPVEMETPLKFEVRPQALNIIVPAGDSDG